MRVGAGITVVGTRGVTVSAGLEPGTELPVGAVNARTRVGVGAPVSRTKVGFAELTVGALSTSRSDDNHLCCQCHNKTWCWSELPLAQQNWGLQG